MNKQLGKNTKLEISGEETEVDKNIIDTLGEPLMHLIRNSLDHGIESKEERLEKGKDERGLIALDAVNTGGDVIISIQDDGKGLDRDTIIEKASKNNLLTKSPEEMSDKEVFSLILLPGFSTKEDVTEYSGRGVGMDVVKRSIEKVGGNIQIESKKDKGTTISIKIPLTLAIIDGMKISVGESIFTVPTTTIKESFKAKKEDLIKDTTGNEMIMIRGDVYPVVRLHDVFRLKSEKQNLLEGILVMVETEESSYCLFADEILGEQQVVVKPIPGYLRQYKVKDSGVAGCAILGNADISLILDISGIANEYI
jgi:two-component system chemotaxis sensor kinase CheA